MEQAWCSFMGVRRRQDPAVFAMSERKWRPAISNETHVRGAGTHFGDATTFLVIEPLFAATGRKERGG
jgi:hypothetical protein